MSGNPLIPVWKDNFIIRSYDTDFNTKLRISNLCGFFQEIAGKHAEHLGLGYYKMKSSGMVWMLSRLYIQIYKYPSWEDEIIVETWPAGMERLFFRRDFQVYRDTQKIISAASFWLAIDTNSLRPRVFPIDETVFRSNAGRFAIEGSLQKIPPPVDGKIKSRDIHYSDLDQNRHVNNTRYVEWVMDQFESGRLEKELPSYFAIEYKHEVKENHIIQIRRACHQADKSAVLLEGIITGTNQVCFRSKVVF